MEKKKIAKLKQHFQLQLRHINYESTFLLFKILVHTFRGSKTLPCHTPPNHKRKVLSKLFVIRQKKE